MSKHNGRVALVFLATAAWFAACSSSSGPSGAGPGIDGGGNDATFDDSGSSSGGDGAATSVTACLGGVASGPVPSACAPLVQCIEAQCGSDLTTCFGPGYASGNVTGACQSFAMCATQNGCTAAAGVSCEGQTMSGCQQCVQGLAACAESKCTSQFQACDGLLTGLVDGGSGSSSGGMDSGSAGDSGAAGEGGDGGGPALLKGVTSITQGDYHTCALLTGGGIDCWGFNVYSQLGNGGTTDSYVPTPATVLPTATAVAAALQHTCAILANGTVGCVGFNVEEGLDGGAGGYDDGGLALVPGLTNATAIAVNAYNSCALLADGTVQCWGAGGNIAGELGNGTTSDVSKTPVPVTGLTGVTALTAGANHFCALVTGGTVQCWGSSTTGALGNGTSGLSGTCNCSDTPVTATVTGVTAIAAGFDFTCALLTGGTVDCWGDDTYGELGTAGTTTCPGFPVSQPCSPLPAPVPGVSGAIGISAGQEYACALLAGGTVECWGGLDFVTPPGSKLPPTMIPGLTGVTGLFSTVSTGNLCVVLPDTTALCGGGNINGQLGNGQIGTLTDGGGSGTFVPVLAAQ